MQVRSQNYLIKWDATISDAINLLDKNGGLICIVIDNEERVVGTVTDGDIRRAMISDFSLMSPVNEISQKNFISTSETSNKETSYALMQKMKLKCIPVLDNEGRFVDLHVAHQFGGYKALPNHAVLMAGGKGKRLFPMTQDVPKPLLQIGDKPILELILEDLVDQGIGTFWISINYLGEKIKQYFDDGSRWGVEINYLEEKKPRGTAGSLELLKVQLSSPILVMNGDVLANININRMIELHERTDALMTVGAKVHKLSVPFGVLEVENELITDLAEKPDMDVLVNAGIYMLDPSIIDLIETGECLDMTDLMQRVIKADGRVSPFFLLHNWIDIGMPEQLQNARETFRQEYR
tara:strand:+ start:5158 stop:6210 length:1053 start_codon:yes stop_codon:yes gene_type:complete